MGHTGGIRDTLEIDPITPEDGWDFGVAGASQTGRDRCEWRAGPVPVHRGYRVAP
jgi:hypothetical protein